MSIFDSPVDERRFLLTALVVAALIFALTVGYQLAEVIDGEPVDLPVLAATGAGSVAVLAAYLGHEE